ncbi:DUF2971 domain-containing protein [uncultured Roseibium sp.]|uniref:DUF2971 domain-containing protein n=1 Tax=uncultured Roseibium sp. TaxID=1936171 RepID=UPI0026162EF9|nr:DUF2971 domain-containing protein [uncultured Roseibium sp.]
MAGTILTDGINRETQIYRTIPLKRFFELFEKNKDALVRPKKWDDTFENLALNSPAEIQGEYVQFGFKDDVYAQCWTLQNFSDAMWRIYSRDTDGIRIRTTVGKLLDNLAKTEPQFSRVSCFIGKVQYKRDNDLKDFADTHFADGLGTDGRKIAETLLIKRNAFRHEQEVRLIYLCPNSTKDYEDLHFYDFDPHQVLDQIMLHPMLKSPERKQLKNKIRTELGWTGELKHSLLYRLPKGFCFKVGT